MTTPDHDNPALEHLFLNNRKWAASMLERDPNFFGRLLAQQTPKFLWIGCSDSRVPANELLGLLPGDVFVHRNIANVIVHSDLNCLSVLQFAIDVLKIRHVIVCGHHGCSGVHAALTRRRIGLATTGCAMCRTCTRSMSVISARFWHPRCGRIVCVS